MKQALRILHVGSGLRPLRVGGLVAYVEDLMAEQVRRGHDVSYFFSGRYIPFLSGPRLKRWKGGGASMLEVVNSPLYDHGRQPELELEEPRLERLFRGVLDEQRPDVVHVQELAGLPSSLLDVARGAGISTVVTLQDYFPLCSTFKLLDADEQVCLRREVGADCAATVAADPREPGLLFEATVRHELARLPRLRGLDPSLRDAAIGRIARFLARRATARNGTGGGTGPPAPAASFQRRRLVNVDRLNRADRLVAMSERVAEIYSLLGVDAGRLLTLQLTLAHIERLHPRRSPGGRPLTFATLNGLQSPAKGARVLLDAMRALVRPASDRGLRLLVLGVPDPAFEREAKGIAGVELRGPYAPEQLDELLDEVDVGIMPSIWEEAYGYAGIEFLAKGIPVISNAIGGLVEYTREGETGWLNRSCSAEELARIMLDLTERPERVAELNARVLEQRTEIVKPLDRHTDEMEAIYRDSIATPA